MTHTDIDTSTPIVLDSLQCRMQAMHSLDYQAWSASAA